jgi:hypothetical protein
VTAVRAGVLEVALEQHGEENGWPVVLLHGFPYDPRCYDRVAHFGSKPVANSGIRFRVF